MNEINYIKDMIYGEIYIGVYLCKDIQIKITKNGGSYCSLLLMDKTEQVDAKIWNFDKSKLTFKNGDAVKVEAIVEEFNSKKQLNITRIRLAKEEEYIMENLVPSSNKSFNELKEEFEYYISKISSDSIKRLVYILFENDDIKKRFFSHTAAKSLHHNYLRGLLHHTVSILKLCDFFADKYNADRNIMFPAAVYHDIGKIYELTSLPDNDYTKIGNLLGHIMIGYELLCKNIDSIDCIDEKIAINIKHCVLSHHGKLEYGSPKVPATLEALCLHLADYSDSRIEAFESAINTIAEGEEKTSYNRLFETYIYKS